MWFVYIVKCADGSLYTGITTNVKRRIEEHNNGNRISAKYTRHRRPVMLVHKEKIETRGKALKREAEIKKLSRIAKEKLVLGR